MNGKPQPLPSRTLPAFLPLILFLAGAPALHAAEPTASADLSGWWEFSWYQSGETNVDRAQLIVSNGKISGKGFGGNGLLEGTLAGDKMEFKIVGDENKTRAEFTGTVHGDVLSGRLKFINHPIARLFSEFDWTARRAVSRPADAPRRHEFQPTQYYRYFSGTPPPALRIFPGDTIHTHTIDAGGIDRNGVRQSWPGNPLSGPIYVEGALRGDTLVIHFNRIRLNRDTARSGRSITPGALEPWYVRDMKTITNFDSNWKLDREKGVAMLANPTDKLKDFSVPLAPMLGCVGVAPAGNQSFPSGDLGSYGGNMDYNQIREGTTVYLPVYQRGALLYVGDGHAAQGDGELTGDALETSMEVEFAVDLIQNKRISGPRVESDEYLMALGIANSLPEALQQATTAMAVWLENDYALNASEVAMVLGFSVQYSIAEVVDPHINVVAKIKKSALTSLTKTAQ